MALIALGMANGVQASEIQDVRGQLVDFTCASMERSEGKILIRALHKETTPIVDLYFGIECDGRENNSTLFEYGTESNAVGAIETLIKYLEIKGKKENKNYLAEILNARDANGETLLDFVQWR